MGDPQNAAIPHGSAKVTWDDTNLYVLFDVDATNMLLGFDKDKDAKEFTATGQPKVWDKDGVELMIEPDAVGNNTNYYEIQISPENKVFHTQFDTYRHPQGPDRDKGPYGHEDWDPKLESKAVIKHSADGKDTGFTVEAAIPWKAFTKAASAPPQSGQVWRMNFDLMRAGNANAWSPLLEEGRGKSFHYAPRFGKVSFVAPGAPAGGRGVRVRRCRRESRDGRRSSARRHLDNRAAPAHGRSPRGPAQLRREALATQGCS